MNEPRKEQTENLITSGVVNFYYGNIPLRIGERSLGVHTPLPRKKTHEFHELMHQ
jgi:hypothetical protein